MAKNQQTMNGLQSAVMIFVNILMANKFCLTAHYIVLNYRLIVWRIVHTELNGKSNWIQSISNVSFGIVIRSFNQWQIYNWVLWEQFEQYLLFIDYTSSLAIITD